MTDREQALVEAAKQVLLRANNAGMVLPENTRILRLALKAYADCPPCCMSPELCAGTGRCPRDPVCNN